MLLAEPIGFAFAFFMGTVLGLVGGGGSILTVPILVYLFHIDVVLATAYSLFIVGVSSAVGAYGYGRKKQIDYKTGFIFAVPAMVGVYLTRKIFVPFIPDTLNLYMDINVSKSNLVMIVFVLMMLASSFSMIKDFKFENKKKFSKRPLPVIILLFEGLVVGVVTGFVGAGGGFIIVPALVLLLGIEMKTAVGTSLLIVAVKSLVGFLGDVEVSSEINWWFLILFTNCSLLGILAGSLLSNRIASEKLKPAFGYLVVIMAGVLLLKEFG